MTIEGCQSGSSQALSDIGERSHGCCTTHDGDKHHIRHMRYAYASLTICIIFKDKVMAQTS